MSSRRSKTSGEALRLAARLAGASGRAEAARALADALGCVEVLVFVSDPLTGKPLPAPGFPQTLPGGRAWRALVAECLERGCATAGVLSPSTGALLPAVARRAEDGSALVLLGGLPDQAAIDDVLVVLPAVAAALSGELRVAVAEAQAHLARSAAAEARALSESLDAARNELQRLYSQVREALEFRDAFLAAAAHDLRTPLTAVTGYVQMLRRHAERGGGAPLDDRQRSALDQVEATGRRMRRLVDQLVDVARLQMGQSLDLERRPTDLAALARRVAAEHQLATERHAIRVEAEQEVIGAWDGVRLERALDNLVGNAVKYSPGGEIVVTTRWEDDAGDRAILTVRDRGVGIPAVDLPHVFDRFRRATNVGGVVGTGIGLASVRQIVEEHGGTVEVESAEGEGSTFTVRLPRGERGHPCP